MIAGCFDKSSGTVVARMTRLERVTRGGDEYSPFYFRQKRKTW